MFERLKLARRVVYYPRVARARARVGLFPVAALAPRFATNPTSKGVTRSRKPGGSLSRGVR